MTRLLTEGFEMQDLVNYGRGHTDWPWPGGEPSISTSIKRSGRASGVIGHDSWLIMLFADSSEIYIRTGIYIFGNMDDTSETATILWLGNDNDEDLGYIKISLYKIEIYVGGALKATGVTTLTSNTWYLLEIYVKIADSGTITVRINGMEDSTWSGDTKPGSNAIIGSLMF